MGSVTDPELMVRARMPNSIMRDTGALEPGGPRSDDQH